MEVLRTAILDMLRRKKGEILTSTEVVQRMFPEDWEQFIEDVNKVAQELESEGLINLAESKAPHGSESFTPRSLDILPRKH